MAKNTGLGNKVVTTGGTVEYMAPSIRTTLVASIATLVLVSCGGDPTQELAENADVTDVSLEPLSNTSTTEAVQLDRPLLAAPSVIPTELIITDILEGTGRAVSEGDTVWVDYTGVRSADGLEFDNSYQRGEPIAFTVGIGSVIDGWDTGLIGAKAGGQRRLDIPADMAYGDNPPGGVIEAGDALTFMLEIRAVVATSTSDDMPEIDTAAYPPTEDLELTDLSIGEGAVVQVGDSAILHLLIGNADSGDILFETWSEGQPTLIQLVEGYSIPGLYEGLQGMAVGGTRAMSVPAELAFGDEGIPDLGLAGGTPILLVVELVGTY
jgi:peptidylprolyl isomerase